MQTIAFVGGGTAGHVMPNLAIISAIGKDYNCVYIGCDGMEKELCEARGIPFHTIKAVKFRRDAILKNLAIPFKLASCVKSAKHVLAKVKPDLIFSKGGYASLPVVLAAKHIPVISHESDFSPGLCTKLAKRKSKYVLCAFESCAAKFKNGVHCGTPLRRELYAGAKQSRAALLSRYGLDGRKPVLTVVGGSSGAASVNEAVVAALPALLKHFDVIHVTGKNKQGGERAKGYTPVQFETDMGGLYSVTDVAVTRAGANALAELIALGVPALAIPLEKASRGDQLLNAEYFESKGAVKVLRESGMTAETLVAAVLDLYNRRSRYKAAQAEIEVDGTDKIAEIIKNTLKTK